MTTSIWSNYAGNLALAAQLHRSGLWLAAHVANPTPTGDLSTEVAGGGYERQPITFSSPSGKACATTRKAYYSGMPAVVVPWFAVWDSPSAGNMIVAIGVDPVSVAAGQQLRVEAGDLAVRI